MSSPPDASAASVLERELAYYNSFYDEAAIAHFYKPAVVAFREYLAHRILTVTGAGPHSRVLSIGCGIGDSELLLAPHVGEITGVDLSPRAIEHANRLARERQVNNVHFLAGSWESAQLARAPFDLVLAIFFLHHLPDQELASLPARILPLLRPGGRFYALDPSAWRLSGFVGRLLVPHLMRKYQTEDERQLVPSQAALPFLGAGFDVATRWFDFLSTPLAGLFPSWKFGYRVARVADHALTRTPGLRALSSNFELIATRRG